MVKVRLRLRVRVRACVLIVWPTSDAVEVALVGALCVASEA